MNESETILVKNRKTNAKHRLQAKLMILQLREEALADACKNSDSFYRKYESKVLRKFVDGRKRPA